MSRFPTPNSGFRSRRGSADKDDDKATKWAITYGDMMSLLLCFFIAIVSFSTIEIERYRAAMSSFRSALQTPITKSRSAAEPLSPPLPTREVAEAAEEVEQLAIQAGLEQGVELQTSPEGIKIILTDPVTFDEGSDELKPGAASFLTGIAGMPAVKKAGSVQIEGHTDDTPIRTARFPSNWELSAARALRVLRLFQSQGLAPEKLAALGYGEYRPRKRLTYGATREEKRVNRRVEIYIRQQEPPATGLFSRMPAQWREPEWGE
ncbi:MAG: hypothetical protein FJY67_08530 [Calditrichaeota bacterium]|nr:hypothetical protein [Calditrichota bacterium]